MHDQNDHQASGLRSLRPTKPVQVIAVTSGKGGVGKTSVSVNLATAISMSGRKTLLLDGDMAMANVDVMLGLQPTFNLANVLQGDCQLEETILEGPGDLMVIPASSGKRSMAQLNHSENAGLIRAFSELHLPLDVLVVDTAAGIADSVITFTQASQEVIVVICNDPSSMTDAYALIKVLNRDYGVERVKVLVNQARNLCEAREVHDGLRRVAERFLNVAMSFVGFIPYDEWLRRSIRRQSPVVMAYPNSISAKAFMKLAAESIKWGVPPGARGNLEFFVERLVGNGPVQLADEAA